MEELLDKKPLPDSLKEVIRKIPELFGSLKLIQEARKLTSNPKSLRAIRRLEKLYQLLEAYGWNGLYLSIWGCWESISIIQGLFLRPIHMEQGIIWLQAAGMINCWCSLGRIRLQ